jgi:PAS domain S-box-containing protein
MYQRLVESLTEYGVLMLDGEGRIVSWNAGAEKLLGFSAEEIIGKPITSLYSREDLQAYHPQTVLETTLQNDGSYTFSINAQMRNGELRRVHATVLALYDTRYDARHNIHRTMEGFACVLRNAEEAMADRPAWFDNVPTDVQAEVEKRLHLERELNKSKLQFEQRLNQRTDLLQEAILQLQEEVARRDDIETKLRQRTEIMHDFIQQLEQEMEERKQIEATLRLGEERFRQVIEKSPIGICIANEHGTIEYANPAFCSMLSYKAHELAGSPLLMTLPLNKRTDFHEAYKALFKHLAEPTPSQAEHNPSTADGLRGELSLLSKDGTIITALLDTVPILSQNSFQQFTHASAEPSAESSLESSVDHAPKKAGASTLHTQPQSTQARLTEQAAHASPQQAPALAVQHPARTYTTYREADRKLILFAMDITQRKHAEDLYKRSKLIIDQSPAVIYQFANAPGFPIEFISENVIQFGYTPDEIISLSHSRTHEKLWYVHPGDRTGAQGIFRILRNKKVYHLRREFRLMTKQGEYRWVENNLVASRDATTGAITHYQGVLFDITDRKQAEEEVQRALNKERQLLDLKGRFITIASHEFRTPLTSIMLAAGILKDFGMMLSDDQRDENLSIIRTSVEYMTQLLEDMFMFDRVDSASMTFKEAHIQLRSWCEEFLRRKQNTTGQRHALQYTLPPDDAVYIGDESMLTQILDRLTSNAFKYSPEGSVVRFDVSTDAKRAKFIIADNGIGIPADDLIHIFEPFHRGSNIGEIRGTGMGLAILRKLIELHGGTIDVESHVGEGTTVTLTLPLDTRDIFLESQQSRRVRTHASSLSSAGGDAGKSLV